MLRFEFAFKQRLFEPCQHSGGGAFAVLATESMVGAFDYDELSLDVILLKRFVNVFAVTDRDQTILISVNEQCRRIVR